MGRIVGVLFVCVVFSYGAELIEFDNNWADAPLFTVTDETANGCEIIFSMHKMIVGETAIDGVPMKTYGVPGVFIVPEGAPNLTGASRYIAFPRGATVRATIVSARTEMYHDVEVAPASNIPREDDDSPLRYEKDMTIYSHNAYYPASPVKVSKPMQMRGVDVILLGVVPFQYNPVTKEMLVYKDIRIKVDFVGGTGQFGEDRLRSRFWEPILKNHLLNYSSLPEIDFYAPERLDSRSGYEYIIIVPDDAVFEAWGDTIKQWRILQGISCDVFTLTEVGGSTKEAIKSFLENAYNTWDPAPVAFLLLSDYPSSGKGYGITSNVLPHPGYYPAYATDNWYADFDNDTLPEMHHGRICAQHDVHLSTIINKMLSYERNPYTDANFYDQPLVACGWQTSRWFQMCIEVCKGFFVNELGKTPQHQANVYSGDPYAGCEWTSRSGSGPVIQYWVDLGYIPSTNPHPYSYWDNGSAAGVNAAINSGAFMVQHRDHGSETGWSEPSYHNSDLDGLNNDMYTFVNSTNCLTGRYHWSSECFTEKFYRIAHGALGVNGASSVSYSFVNDTYIWGIFDGLWPFFDPGYPATKMTGSDDLRPCQAMTSGKYYLEASWFPDQVGAGSYRNITYGLFHHHSDCFVTLYSEIPDSLTVVHDSVLPDDQEYFTVTADSGSVIALTVNYAIIGVAEGTGSSVDIPIAPQTAGDTMVVTVTKANYYRYEQDVPVVEGVTVPLEAPFITQVSKSGNHVDLVWLCVTQDTMHNPASTDYYTVYRDTMPDFMPSSSNSIGTCNHPDTTFTDNNALRDEQNYYYSVKAVDVDGRGSLRSNMGYVFYRCVNENPITTDKNWVSLPYWNDYTTVSDLTDDVSPSGDPLTKITYLRDDQMYDSWIWDPDFNQWQGTDFTIWPDRAYEMVAIRDDSVVFTGCNDPDGLMFLNENATPQTTDKNWIPVPYNAIYNTVSDITNEYCPSGNPVCKIAKLRDDQLFESYLWDELFTMWIGADFTIVPGVGYEFVAVCDTFWNPTEHSGGKQAFLASGNSGVDMQLGSSVSSDRRPQWPVVRRNTPYVTRHTQRNASGVGRHASSHVVRIYCDVTDCEDVIFTAYRPGLPDDVLTEKTIGSGIARTEHTAAIWFDAGNFAVPWQDQEKIVIVIEARCDGPPRLAVSSVVLDGRRDIQDCAERSLQTIPGPVVNEGVVSWTGVAGEYIIGYSIYRGTERINDEICTGTIASDCEDITLRPVFVGGHETVYGTGDAQTTGLHHDNHGGFVISPRPFKQRLVISYQLADGSTTEKISLKIYDVTGRMVRQYNCPTMQQSGQIIWDATDEHGDVVSAGIYFVEFVTSDYMVTEKVILMR